MGKLFFALVTLTPMPVSMDLGHYYSFTVNLNIQCDLLIINSLINLKSFLLKTIKVLK